KLAVRFLLQQFPALELSQGMVTNLLFDQGGTRISGVETGDGRRFTAHAVIITAGTFLRGRIHLGTDTQIPAGRAGDAPSIEMAQVIANAGLTVSRFKTGTPPRIDGRSVNWSTVERQDGDSPDFHFSFHERVERPRQVPCWITWAGEEVKDIIQRHLKESALYGGAISGRGPRYCPSVEDKIVKFPDAKRHQIFLEPEGLDTTELYVNGLSTSLPLAEQLGLLTDAELRAAERRLAAEESALRLARETTISPEAAAGPLAESGTSLVEGDRIAVIAKRPRVSLAALFAAAGVGADVAAEVIVAAEIEIKYDGYLAREREAAARLAELAAFVLPSDLPYLELRTF